LQEQVLVPGPELAHAAFASQPPWATSHELIGAQTVPLPAYPVLQAQVRVPGPVEVHAAFASQPPLSVTVHRSMGAQVLPSPA
jgi:hypothetical protein